MAGYDYRTDPAATDKLSFYVYDNLRSHVDRGGGNVFRCDSVPEAAAVCRYVSAEHPDWRVALGDSILGTSEIDLIQKVGDVDCVVNDYQQLDFWRDAPEVKEAIQEAAGRLQVEWQVDRSILGSPIIVPYSPGETPLDPYLQGKALRPMNPENALSAIQEAFVEGKGWLSPDELRAASKAYGHDNPECPRVSRLNASYVDMAPSGYRHMASAYLEAAQEKAAGKEAAQDVKTMEGWHDFTVRTGASDFYDYVQPGDVVSADMVDHFANIVPPTTLHQNLVQVGSTYDDRMGEDGKLHPTFATFAKEDGAWRYCGHCFHGEAREPQEPQAREESLDDLMQKAKEKAAEKNLERPEKQQGKDQGLER